MTRGDVCVKVAIAILLVLASPTFVRGWGDAGHAMVARAAIDACDDLPSWFREAGDALADLSNAPDRWRDEEGDVPALAARRPEHFFDLDLWGAGPLPIDRWGYDDEARRRRLRPDRIGVLPYAILEHYGILVSGFRDARAGRPGARSAVLAAAGTVSHLAADATVPLHVTKHHHGWVGPNPRGFTRLGEVHQWFETDLVRRLDAGELTIGAEARRPLGDVRGAVEATLTESLANVPRVYEAERRARLAGEEHEARLLVRARLGAAATLVARLWRTAWIRSALEPKAREIR